MMLWTIKSVDAAVAFKRSQAACTGVLLAITVLILTNWYFTPARRLDRLAGEMHYAALQEASFDEITTLMHDLQVRTGGSTAMTTSCSALPCTVTLRQSYSSDAVSKGGRRTWNFVVAVAVEPYSPAHEVALLAPPTIKWRALDWRWTVSVDGGTPQPTVFSGELGQLNAISIIGGSPAIVAHLRSMAAGMNKRLHS
ncbi:hypothetical protein [Rugamonas apoptosis]|uniref:Uncharacterized protein n=1 Tax=Rugamonas apoptosis TaxID=2758570 RepID=A0A7W2F8T5_9BURK|nr:hypothetical protein [Rugamonas apoptosis]MBA5687216.1 hypothetical protein [Rugamonas apoptosis]